MGGNDNAPKAYSTQLGGDYETGYRADGYNVVIDPDKLQASIDNYRQDLRGQNPADLISTVTNALIAQGAFGVLPHAAAAYTEVRNFVRTHAEAMSQMGISLEDFVARVQAAADLGYQADPVTKQEAARYAHNLGMGI
jgi:hypothetical protein